MIWALVTRLGGEVTLLEDKIDPHWNLEFSVAKVRPEPGRSKVDGLKIVANTKPPAPPKHEDQN